MNWSEEPDAEITAALEQCDGIVRPKGPAAWSLSLMNGRAFDVAVAIDSERQWLLLNTSTQPALDSQALWRALAINPALPGTAKFAMDRTGLCLRAEVPLDRREPLGARLMTATAGFKKALESLEGGAGSPEAESIRAVVDAGVDLAERCREAGWDVTPRSNGTLVADLRCGPRFCQAFVEPRSDGGVLVWSELAAANALSDRSRQALAMLLLETSALIRFARAGAIPAETRAKVHLEVALDAAPEPTDLDHALSALSAGCMLARDEARALVNDEVAERYLSFRTLQT